MREALEELAFRCFVGVWVLAVLCALLCLGHSAYASYRSPRLWQISCPYTVACVWERRKSDGQLIGICEAPAACYERQMPQLEEPR